MYKNKMNDSLSHLLEKNGKPKLIGLIGKIGSGKTTFANHAKEIGIEKKYNVVELAFAEPIKEIAKIIGFKHEEVYGTQQQKEAKNANYDISGRTFMQHFGTYIRDHMPDIVPGMRMGRNLWLAILENKLRELESTGDGNTLIIVSDCRFSDETDLIKNHGGSIIYINLCDKNAAVEVMRENNFTARHVSEEMATHPNINYPDITIHNDCDLVEYKKKVRAVCEHIMEGKMPGFKMLDIMEI